VTLPPWYLWYPAVYLVQSELWCAGVTVQEQLSTAASRAVQRQRGDDQVCRTRLRRRRAARAALRPRGRQLRVRRAHPLYRMWSRLRRAAQRQDRIRTGRPGARARHSGSGRRHAARMSVVVGRSVRAGAAATRRGEVSGTEVAVPDNVSGSQQTPSRCSVETYDETELVVCGESSFDVFDTTLCYAKIRIYRK